MELTCSESLTLSISPDWVASESRGSQPEAGKSGGGCLGAALHLLLNPSNTDTPALIYCLVGHHGEQRCKLSSARTEPSTSVHNLHRCGHFSGFPKAVHYNKVAVLHELPRIDGIQLLLSMRSL